MSLSDALSPPLLLLYQPPHSSSPSSPFEALKVPRQSEPRLMDNLKNSACRIGLESWFLFIFLMARLQKKQDKNPVVQGGKQKGLVSLSRSPFKSDSQRVEIALCTPVSRRKLFLFLHVALSFFETTVLLESICGFASGSSKKMEPGTVFVTNYKVFVLGFCPSNQVQILCLCYFSLIACLFVW